MGFPSRESDLFETMDYAKVGSRTVAEIAIIGHQDDEIRFVGEDHLGSTRVPFTEDGERVDFASDIEYTPFGTIKGGYTPETSHLFTGHERDLGSDSSQLDYMHQRYYSNQLGRFVSQTRPWRYELVAVLESVLLRETIRSGLSIPPA